jgi:hypothetical protein
MTPFLIFILALVIILLIAASLIDKEMNIEHSIVIKRPLSEVFDYVKLVKNHEQFSVWMMMDPDMKKGYKGTDGQVGFVYIWDSAKQKNVGAGEQEIKKIEEGKTIEYELRFSRPMQDVAKAIFIFKFVSATETQVQWGFYSQMKFPMVIMKPIMKKVLGNALSTGLTNLKTVLEK